MGCPTIELMGLIGLDQQRPELETEGFLVDNN